MDDEIPPASGPNNPGATRRPIFATTTRTQLQSLFDEGDAVFFAHHPDEHLRIRFYFRGERIDGGGEASRYVGVSPREDGRLERRFVPDGGGA